MLIQKKIKKIPYAAFELWAIYQMHFRKNSKSMNFDLKNSNCGFLDSH
jgi:hypothetical protein